MKRDWWSVTFAIALVAILTLAAGSPSECRWVGSTDLEVRFEVANALTGESIPEATINIDSEGGCYEGSQAGQFQLQTASDGVVTYQCLQNRCIGTDRGGVFGRKSTRYVSPPPWRFKVTAKDYVEKNWEYIHDYYRDGMQRIEAGRDLFLVRLALQPIGK
jgi:hypothetical protein